MPKYCPGGVHMENRKRRIVVADDSSTMVAIIGNLLTKRGYNINQTIPCGLRRRICV